MPGKIGEEELETDIIIIIRNRVLWWDFAVSRAGAAGRRHGGVQVVCHGVCRVKPPV